MRASNRFIASLSFTAALAAACTSDSEIRLIDPTSFEADHLFFIGLDVDDRPVEVIGPIPTRDPDRSAASVSDPRIASLLVIELEEEELGPFLDASRLAELELVARAPEDCSDPALPGHVTNDESWLEIVLPASTDIARVSIEDGRRSEISDVLLQEIRGDFTLRVPADAQSCTGHTRMDNSLRAFAEVTHPIALGSLVDDVTIDQADLYFSSVTRVSGDRAVVTGRFHVFMFERGRPFTADPEHVLRVPEATALNAVVWDPAPERGTNGHTRLIVGGAGPWGAGENRLAAEGAIWTLALGPNGFGDIETATSTDWSIERLDVDPETGRVVAASGSGQLVIQDVPGGPWRSVQAQPEPPGELNPPSLSRTGWPERPYIAGGIEDGYAYISDPSLERWTLTAEGLIASRGYRAFRSVGIPPESVLWGVSTTGDVQRLRRGGTGWDTLRVFMPPSYECAAEPPTCGWRRHESRGTEIDWIERDGRQWVYVTGDDCMGIAVIPADGACASYLRIPDPEDPSKPLAVPNRPTAPGESAVQRSLRSGRIFQGWLTVVSGTGGVYERWVGEGDPPS